MFPPKSMPILKCLLDNNANTLKRLYLSNFLQTFDLQLERFELLHLKKCFMTCLVGLQTPERKGFLSGLIKLYCAFLAKKNYNFSLVKCFWLNTHKQMILIRIDQKNKPTKVEKWDFQKLFLQKILSNLKSFCEITTPKLFSDWFFSSVFCSQRKNARIQHESFDWLRRNAVSFRNSILKYSFL